jgi:hypothetical protein
VSLRAPSCPIVADLEAVLSGIIFGIVNLTVGSRHSK